MKRRLLDSQKMGIARVEVRFTKKTEPSTHTTLLPFLASKASILISLTHFLLNFTFVLG